mgnify:CR=1 FL=1
MKKFRVYYSVNAEVFSDIFEAQNLQHALCEVELIYDCYDTSDVSILSVRPMPSPADLTSIPRDIYSGELHFGCDRVPCCISGISPR